MDYFWQIIKVLIENGVLLAIAVVLSKKYFDYVLKTQNQRFRQMLELEGVRDKYVLKKEREILEQLWERVRSISVICSRYNHTQKFKLLVELQKETRLLENYHSKNLIYIKSKISEKITSILEILDTDTYKSHEYEEFIAKKNELLNNIRGLLVNE